jgi:hypothetical protein
MYMMHWEYIEYFIVLIPTPVIQKDVDLRLMRGLSVHHTFWFPGSTTSVDNKGIIFGLINCKFEICIPFQLGLTIKDYNWQIWNLGTKTLKLRQVVRLSDNQASFGVLGEVFNLGWCRFYTQWYTHSP